MISDPWEHTIAFEIGTDVFVYSEHLLNKVVTDISKQDGRALRRVTSILRKLGFKPHVRKKESGKTERGWLKGDNEKSQEEIDRDEYLRANGLDGE